MFTINELCTLTWKWKRFTQIQIQIRFWMQVDVQPSRLYDGPAAEVQAQANGAAIFSCSAAPLNVM
jgi:hypothetical protein